MKATHDYVGKDDSELTFKQGDTIMVPAPELEGKKDMIKGVCSRRHNLEHRVVADSFQSTHLKRTIWITPACLGVRCVPC